ncbi:Nucleolar protein 12 [Escovopsis weberi]|uniref:Nucleolar protein 12 n=1 Tax=Escovopsis weberi TaxID=150374 RepID=A0A0M8N1J6_ESCWE|nr:Nucleolar protein 12 [Escovopsis weberi]
MAKKGNPLAVASKAIDPTLDALFASSAGPVTAPPKTRYAAPPEKRPSKPEDAENQDVEMQDGDDEVLSEISEELDYGDDDDDEEAEEKEQEEEEEEEDDEGAEPESKTDDKAQDAAEATVESGRAKKDRKRKRKDDNEDLEGRYLAELAKQDDAEPTGKRQKPEGKSTEGSDNNNNNKDNGDGDDDENDDDDDDDDDDDEKPPQHETLTQDGRKADVEKAARTVFLANVSSEAITSKAAKKTLMKHLASVLDADASPAEKLESLRFRSVAFAGGAMPKRAAFITKSFMDATTKSANAYAVFSTAAAARKVAAGLNGSEVLERHLRVDSVAHPSPMDHRRCVFVGNLGFVDDETVLNKGADGETVQKKRNKVPADVEEGLWRTFGAVGKVENVRVVRDPKTRVGKGFAYVQFYDGNDVEAALLHDGKKFPPMLPRPLRVTRAKDPRKTASALDKARSKADAAADKQIIFEGRRASSKDALPKDLKGKKGKAKGKAKGQPKPKGRSARRASAWKQGKK